MVTEKNMIDVGEIRFVIKMPEHKNANKNKVIYPFSSENISNR